MKFEHTKVMGITEALRGMRNPMNSWDKCDTLNTYDKLVEAVPILDTVVQSYLNKYDDDFLYDIFPDGDIKKYLLDNCNMTLDNIPCEKVFIGANDLDLAQRLIRAGSPHCKFMRQIFVSVDITAPLYFYSEFDTYKVGTVANSTSKMHKLASTPITMNCFEKPLDDDLRNDEDEVMAELTEHTWQTIIDTCETLRTKYNETKNMDYWKELIRMLPESWLQTRTVTLNYENLRNMYAQRQAHKLTEWRVDFCNWVKKLPYADKLLTYCNKAI